MELVDYTLVKKELEISSALTHIMSAAIYQSPPLCLSLSMLFYLFKKKIYLISIYVNKSLIIFVHDFKIDSFHIPLFYIIFKEILKYKKTLFGE